MTTLVKSISLHRADWGPDKGKLAGSIEFVNQYGEMKIAMNNEQCERIVSILAENLVNTAKQTAALMTSEVLNNALPSPETLEA